MPYVCDICGKNFSTLFNMQRHKRNVHHQSNFTKPTRPTIGSNVMQHPLTCIVAGFTKSGKTVWVNKILENAKTTISPPPEQIIWCYGQ